MLKFTQGNAKLDKGISIFSLPAGWSCPGAKDCLSCALPSGKIRDGKETKFRCYATSEEIIFPNVRKSRWNNFKQLRGKSKNEMVKLIQESLPKFTGYIRIHSSGDFFSQTYFDAWREVAKRNPHKTFYAYTKSLKFWIKRKKNIPKNLKLNASFGGKFDYLIKKNKLKSVKVVFSVNEAEKQKLKIDHDDSLAIFGRKSFALLLHGVQPAQTDASKAISALRSQGLGGYSRK